MKLAREGFPIVFGLGGAALLFNLLGWWWAGLAALVAMVGTVAFFRDPDRQAPVGADLVVSPADGRIVAIRPEASAESYPESHGPCVSIFMSVANVHVNRVPETGEVVSVRHTPGRFLAAFRDRASLENERNEVAVRDATGRLLVFVQIAGLVARRIVCHLRPGQTVTRGERFGLIMFGSRVDVYFPPGSRLRVRVGDRVRAGLDVLGELET